jgi:hemerythrin
MAFRHYPGGGTGAIGAAMRHARRRLCERLACALDPVRTPDADFVREFPVLVARVEAGFRHEETVMELLDYHRLHDHLADNAVVLAALHRALPLIEDGDIALGRGLIAALLDLLSLHRLCTDLALVTMPRTPPGRQGSHLAGALKRRDYFKPSR